MGKARRTNNKKTLFAKSIYSGKHSNNKIKFFCFNNSGKHAKNEMTVYNPLYAKLSTCIGSFAVAISFLAFATFGKYKGTLASADAARVAKYIIELSEPETTITEFIPNTTRTIDFEIKDFEGEIENIIAQNEVKTRYKIVVGFPNTWNLPVECKLYRVYSENSKEEINFVNGESDYFEFGLSSVVHKYRLELKWQSGHEEIYYQNLTDNITISIESEQMD